MSWPLRETGIGQNQPFPRPLPRRPFRVNSPIPRLPHGSASQGRSRRHPMPASTASWAGTCSRTRSPIPTEPRRDSAPPDASFDRQLVRDLLAHLITDPDVAMEYFYARLFADNPGLRGLFPYTMTQTRDAVFGMLAGLVRKLDDEEATQGVLGQLARDHRKFGVKEKHYQPFFDALFAMAEHVGGPVLTAEMAVAWRSALDYFAAVMSAAAA